MKVWVFVCFGLCIHLQLMVIVVLMLSSRVPQQVRSGREPLKKRQGRRDLSSHQTLSPSPAKWGASCR